MQPPTCFCAIGSYFDSKGSPSVRRLFLHSGPLPGGLLWLTVTKAIFQVGSGQTAAQPSYCVYPALTYLKYPALAPDATDGHERSNDPMDSHPPRVRATFWFIKNVKNP